jgi:hypothetical protein
VSGTSVQNTGVAVSGNVGAALKTSSVLQSVQVVDGLNRNFTADFTKAIGVNTPANSLYTSPYLAMQSLGYKEFTVPMGKDSTLTLMQSFNGVAAQYETGYKEGRISFQTGTMTERNGFLNNSGTGLFGMGNSATSYAMIGGSYPIVRSVDLIGNYGVGITRTSNAQDSMLALSPTIISDTWKLGIAKKEIFFSGSTQDQLTLAVHGPVAVRRGSADVTAVTGYTYSGAEDDVTANPIISKQRVNLAAGQRQQDLILSYSVSVSNKTYAGISVAKQFNVGGIGGQTGSAFGLMVRSVF